MKKIISYKFILLILCPLMSVILSAIFLCMIPHNVFLLFVFAISLLCIGLLLYFEPVYYIINENEIKVICVFKQYRFLHKEIKQILLKFDAFFEFLFIKDYVLNIDMGTKIPERCKRIVKCAKTKKLIEEHYGEKIIDNQTIRGG